MPNKDEIANFSTIIEKIADNQKMHCLDAIVQYCDETGLEVEVAATLISLKLKSRIQEEAQSINLLKKSARLPI